MDASVSEIKVPKWRFYLLLFIALWGARAAASFMKIAYTAGYKVWAILFYHAVFAAFLSLLFYFMHKDEK